MSANDGTRNMPVIQVQEGEPGNERRAPAHWRHGNACQTEEGAANKRREKKGLCGSTAHTESWLPGEGEPGNRPKRK